MKFTRFRILCSEISVLADAFHLVECATFTSHKMYSSLKRCSQHRNVWGKPTTSVDQTCREKRKKTYQQRRYKSRHLCPPGRCKPAPGAVRQPWKRCQHFGLASSTLRKVEFAASPRIPDRENVRWIHFDELIIFNMILLDGALPRNVQTILPMKRVKGTEPSSMVCRKALRC